MGPNTPLGKILEEWHFGKKMFRMFNYYKQIHKKRNKKELGIKSKYISSQRVLMYEIVINYLTASVYLF